MIQAPLTKILFFDLETIGIVKDYDELTEKHPELKKQFLNYFDWFIKRFPEDKDLPPEQVFVNRAALVPEFTRIVCASFAFVTPDGKIHKQVNLNRNSGQTIKEIGQYYQGKNLVLKFGPINRYCNSFSFYYQGHFGSR